MQKQYPFHADAAGAATIYDPLTKVAITTLPFQGKSTVQKLMGVSLACDADVFLNNVRIRIGNSLPDYRYFDISPNGHNNCDEVLGHKDIVNYHDLGGQEIREGDTITITYVTGTFLSGVLHVEDMEGEDPPIPSGNLCNVVMNGLADLGASIASTTIDTRKLDNNRLYSLYMTKLLPEGSAAISIEIIMLQCGARTVCIPMDTMIWKKCPFSFSGLEWNQGQVICYGQAEAAEKFDLRVYLVESALPGAIAGQSANSLPIGNITPSDIPGVLSVPTGGGRVTASRQIAPGAKKTFTLRR